MQKMLFIFNCHGGQIKKQLSHLPFIFEEIIIYNYLLKGYIKDKLEYFDNNDLHKIKDADIIIAQNVKNLRGKYFISIEHIKTIAKSECKIIKIPHYTFMGYFLQFDYNKIEDINYFINNYGDEKDIKENLHKALNHIKELDELSDIKCYDFVKENYCKYRLFHGKIYPTFHFFNFIAQQLCKILGHNTNIKKVFTSYALAHNLVIFPNVKKHLKLEFNNELSFSCTLEEYFTICKNLNTNELYLLNRYEGKKHLKELENLRKN